MACRPGLSRPSPSVRLPDACQSWPGVHGGNRRFPPYSYGSLVDLFALEVAHLYFAVVDELLEMSAQRHLGRTEQLASQLIAVDAACQVRGGAAAAFLQLRQHLGFASQPMGSVLLELR